MKCYSANKAQAIGCIIGLAALIGSLPAYADDGGCKKDTDCKGQRICEKGTCVNPPKKKEVPKEKKTPPDVMVISGRTWQRHARHQKMSAKDAAEYCKGVVLGGKRGWRLPTKMELQSIPLADESKCPQCWPPGMTGPYGEGDCKPGTGWNHEMYWTSTQWTSGVHQVTKGNVVIFFGSNSCGRAFDHSGLDAYARCILGP